MPTVVPAQRPSLSRDDIAMFSDAFHHLSRSFRWPHWELEARDENGGGERIVFVNPEDWEWLKLSRTMNGGYHAEDLDGVALADADTFSDLMAEIGLMQA